MTCKTCGIEMMLLRRGEDGAAVYVCRNAACPEKGREKKEGANGIHNS
ncbi:MAG: hypothetical protein V8T01_07195 [Oscillospiraceae bacterium]